MSAAAHDAGSSETSSGYEDGLGRRVLAIDRESGDMRERLRLRPELTVFAAALEERLPIAAGLEDDRFARPRLIVPEPDGRLSVLSDYVPGRRLSDILDAAAEDGIVAGLDAGLGLLLEILAGLSRLHDAGLTHGALAPGRIVISATGQVVLVDAIYAGALERLQLTRKRLWSELRLAFPQTAGAPRFDKAADLTQAALTAAALMVGRPLRDDEYPEGLSALRQEISEIASIRGSKTFADGLDKFFGAALPLSTRKTPIASADEAAIDIRKLLRKEVGITTCQTAMLDFFQQVDAAERDRSTSGVVDEGRREAERAEAERRQAERQAERLEAEARARAREEADRQAREEAERRAREEADRRAREEAERKAREEAERKIREEAERKAREEAERRAREEAERKAREEAEKKAREEAERKARAEAERRAREEAERKAREEAERKAREEAERRAREEAERKAREEAQRREREEAERRAREEAERKAREEAERKAREAAEKKAREEAERKARAEAERRAREEAERKAREEAERKAREEAERKAREAAEKKAREEAERKAREEAERKAREEAERKAREEAERKAREEAERKAREAAEKKAREEAERKAREAAEKKAREEAERIERARVEAEKRERERIETERRERERAEQEARERIERARVEAERVERERIDRERAERERAERERIEAETRDAERRERQRVEQEARERERQEREREREQRERDRQERDREERERISAQAPNSAGWLVPPDTAAAFEPAVDDEPAPPPPAATAYPIYTPSRETQSWTPEREPPAAIEIAPVAASRPLAPTIRLQPDKAVTTIRLKDEPEPASSAPSRADSRHEPEEISAAGAYEPFHPIEEDRPIPWKLIAAGVVLIAATFGIVKGYLPSEIPTPGLGKRANAEAKKAPPPPAPVAGSVTRVSVTTDPAGVRVLVDGKVAGTSPLTIDKISPGRHTLTLQAAGGSIKRTIRVEPGQTLAVDVPMFSGFVEFGVPFVVEVAENGKVIGTSENPIILGPGNHVLHLQNKDLDYSAGQSVDVLPGETTRLRLDPRGSANINAAPWAEVIIDGENAGQTPLANVPIRLGVREIVFRNPQFPERKIVTTIKAGVPATISVDFTKDK